MILKSDSNTDLMSLSVLNEITQTELTEVPDESDSIAYDYYDTGDVVGENEEDDLSTNQDTFGDAVGIHPYSAQRVFRPCLKVRIQCIERNVHIVPRA